MATPTASSASKRPAGGVSTPSHLNQSSPAPRSVPSPVATRHPAVKTPINHSTVGSSHGSKTAGGTPMVQNLSQPGNISSPGAHLLGFNTPNGLGIDGATPAGLSMTTPALGSISMMATMSDLGLNANGGRRNEDEERRAKMRKILKDIGRPKGRVGEEGIARVSRRVGFANDIDAEKLTPEEKGRRMGNRPISIAGNTFVIDIDLKNHVPQGVQFAHSVANEALQQDAVKAGKVLLADLRAPAGIALHARLDRFAMNLERLARMDRLSSNSISCFEALNGIYTSLSRLYEQEKKAVKALSTVDVANADDKAEVEVMCKKSGWPLLHGRGTIGLRLMYWQEGRHVGNGNRRYDTDMAPKSSTRNDSDDLLFNLRIEAESSPPGAYPPLRVSDSWLPQPLEPPAADSAGGIPWQDPPPTLITMDGSGDAMAIDGDQKLPDLRFVAKLDPPIVMPYQIAMQIFSSVGLPTPAMMAMPPQYAALLLGSTAVEHTQASVGFSTVSTQDVLAVRDGKETIVHHQYILDNAKPDYSFRIEELPFSHPRQLVELLPTLRQWATIGSLLTTTFRNKAGQHGTAGETSHLIGIDDSQLALDDLLVSPEPSQFNTKTPIHIALTTSPVPTLGISFPMLQDGRLGHISVQILPNAEMIVTGHEGIVAAGTNTTDEAKKFARALDICGDLGVWIEWIRGGPA